MSEAEIETVYHYCSLETLLSIFSNRTIRLSDINKSNDYLETKATIELVKNAAMDLCHQHSIEQYQPIMLGIDNEAAMRHLIETVLKRFLNYKDTLVYAACFSEDPDLLSQWCQYADNGRGVAIGFNINCLNEICALYNKIYESSESSLKLDKVTYLSEKNNNLFNEMIRSYANEVYGEIIDSLVDGTLDELFNNPYGMDLQAITKQQQLIKNSVLIKHDSFSAENEWRIVLRDEDLQKSSDNWGDLYKYHKRYKLMRFFPDGIQFRSNRDDIISYLDLSFTEYMDEIINCIYIGPNCKMQIEDMNQIIQHYGFCNFNEDRIYYSKSSYRLNKI